MSVNEARASQGLPAWSASDGGLLTVAEFKAKHSTVVAEAATADKGAATPSK